MLRPETNAREGSMVAPTIAAVLWQEERVVDACSSPERDPVFVILKHALEDWAVLKIWRVVRVEPDEKKSCSRRLCTLIWLPREQLV